MTQMPPYNFLYGYNAMLNWMFVFLLYAALLVSIYLGLYALSVHF